MRFNTIIPIVLTLAGLVSARLSVLSPMGSSVWSHNSHQTIKWTLLSEATDATYLDLYLVCENKLTTTVLSAIKKDISLASTDHVVYQVSSSVKACESYFVKFVTRNNCGISHIFFSSMFYINANGVHQVQLGSCEAGTPKLDETQTSTSTSDSESKTDKETLEHPKDGTPTQTQVTVDETSADSLPPEPTEEQKPVTSEDKDESKDHASTSTESTSTSSPDKKPADLDNHGSILTFKLFGILLTVIPIFIFF